MRLLIEEFEAMHTILTVEKIRKEAQNKTESETDTNELLQPKGSTRFNLHGPPASWGKTILHFLKSPFVK